MRCGQLDFTKIKILVFTSRTTRNHKKIEAEEQHNQTSIFPNHSEYRRRTDAIESGGK